MEIKGESGSHVRLTFSGYERDVEEESPEWLVCALYVCNAGFQARLSLSRTRDELHDFRDALANLQERVSGTARLETLEERIALTVDVRPTGAAEIKGTVSNCSYPFGKLDFSFDSDQSFLAKTQIELDQVLRCYPDRR